MKNKTTRLSQLFRRTLPRDGLIFKCKTNSGMIDTIGQSFKRYSATAAGGAIAYVDNAAIGGPSFTSPNVTYDPVTRTVGSGSATVYDTVVGALNAVSTGTRVYLMPGTYAAAQIGASNSNLAAKSIELFGYTGNRDDVVLNMAASSSYLARSTATGGLLTGRFFTVINCNQSAVFWFYGGGSVDFQWMGFYDCSDRFVLGQISSANNSSFIFRNNKVRGQINRRGTTYPVISLEKSSSGTLTADIQFNDFLPSDSNILATILRAQNLTVNDIVKFADNLLGGTQYQPIYIQGAPCALKYKNNISLGGGLDFPLGLNTIDADASGNLANVDADYNLITNISGTRKYNSNVPGTKAHDINNYARLQQYPRPVFLGLMLDDSSAVAWPAFGQIIESMSARGFNGIWVNNIADYLRNYTAYDAQVKAWLDTGNEVGNHGLNGSSLISPVDGLRITNSTGGAKTVTITCNTVGAGADWNGILKDYMQWSGTITLEGQSPINIGWQNGAFPTLMDVKNKINTFSGWTAEVQAQGVTTAIDPYTPAIVLTDYSQSIANGANTDWLDADKIPYLWVEIKLGKDLLQAYIRANISGYSDYEITTYGCSFHDLDTDGMSAIMEAGHTISRGNNDPVELDLGTSLQECDRFNLTSLARYAIYYLSGTAATITYDNELFAGVFNYLGSFGGVAFESLHVTDFDQSVFNQFLDGIAGSDVNVVTGKELYDIIKDMPTTGTTGATLRVDCSSLFDVDSQDLSLRAGSLCVGGGVKSVLTGSAAMHDKAGIKVYDGTTQLPDGPWLDGVDIGPTAYVVGGKYYLSLLGTAGAYYWPSAPEIIARTGVDNAVYDTNGVGKTFATEALALAALATVEDNTYLFVGAKGAVLFLTDQSANLARIQRAGY